MHQRGGIPLAMERKLGERAEILPHSGHQFLDQGRAQRHLPQGSGLHDQQR